MSRLWRRMLEILESPTVWSWSRYRCRETERLQLLNIKTLQSKFSIPRDASRRHFLWTSLGMLTAVMYLILRVRTWTSSSDNILAVSWSNIYILLWPPGVSCHGKVRLDSWHCLPPSEDKHWELCRQSWGLVTTTNHSYNLQHYYSRVKCKYNSIFIWYVHNII